ncbi:MAG: LLM class flavin-dependent oxidoreductase [Chitinophagaceae bacterium]|nr:LLM class flavin-dependent oxidoreductase [Chitinophagaceae bacterium]
MEIGIGMFGDLRFDKQKNLYQKPSERLHELIEEVKLADELGVDVFAMGEHHRPDYAVSSPEIVLAALATVTKRIKLSSGVSVLSSADPVKLYQDFSTIDLMSDRRVEIMAGRGSFIESFPLFGYELKDYNALFEEKLDLLLQLNTTETLTWRGKFRAPIEEQTVYPRPGRELPVWIAVGGTPNSVLRAARLGLPIIFAIIGGMPSQFLPLIDYYKEQYKQFGHDPAKMEIGVHSHTFIADTQGEILSDYFPYYAAQMDRIGRERGWSPYTRAQFMGGMSEHGALFMGDADAVAEKIIRTIEMFKLTRFVAHIDVGAPLHKETMKTIELYGTKVIPAVKKHFAEKVS